MNLKVLVTGGAGYIGSILVPELLSDGFEVTVIDNLTYRQNSLSHNFYNKKFNFIKKDICDYESINKIMTSFDIIIPLAAIVGAPACNENPFKSKIINYDAQLNLINNLSNEQLLIFPTTNSGYGVGSKSEYCDENSPLNPISDYAKDKVKIEKIFMEKGNAISLRLATVFGMSPRMRTDLLVNDFVLKAIKDRSLTLFEENFRRNYIHVRDVVKGFKFSIENSKTMKGQIFNLGLSNANITKSELAKKIKQYLPYLYIHSANIGTDKDKRDYYVSNEKIEKLGWSPSFSLDDGIKELIKGYDSLIINEHSNI
mgnify:CR=1 FL=1|tara:strand:- start:3208 stop:4146 length:939 start_codon:yes stop_codon:yes gene_type:complete